MIEFEDDLIELDEKSVTPTPPIPSPIPPTPTLIREPSPEPPEPENNLKKAVDAACGKMDDQNRITSGNFASTQLHLSCLLGPLRNRATLFEWISAIHFEGEMIQMLEAGNLLHPKDWLGGGKSNGRV